MKNYLETNEIGNIAIQKSMGHSKSSSKRKVYSNTAYLKVYSDAAHLTDIAKEVLRNVYGDRAYLRKHEKSQINNLALY